MDRLVFGYGTVGTLFLERLADQPNSLVVLVDDGDQAESLRESGIDARRVDIDSVGDIRTVSGEANSVVVAFEGAEKRRTAIQAARSAYPSAFLMVCLGADAHTADRSALTPAADRIVDVPMEAGREFLERAGDSGLRARKLRGTLGKIDGRLGVFTHDNPDPDAIASAIGLRRIATEFGIDAEACYFGEISHQENRALMNLFDFDLRNLSDDADLSEFDAFALVDHSIPGVNDGLPEDTPIEIVIDHHPPRKPIRAGFVDLRSEVGATCTLISGYLRQFGFKPGEALASGLLYGIQTDTQDFSRGVSIADFEAAAELIDSVDKGRLGQVESPSVSTETLETLGNAISNRTLRKEVLATCVGSISDRDTLAQAADRLLDMEDVTTTLVFGYTDDTVYVSARARGTDRDLGEILREAFGQIGGAGGHANMAGAQIPAGILTDETDEDNRGDVIADVITERFFEALGLSSDHTPFVYGGIEDDFVE